MLKLPAVVGLRNATKQIQTGTTLAIDGHGLQIRMQIEEAVYFLFTWSQGTFNFEADVYTERQDLLVSINPESLLLEGALAANRGVPIDGVGLQMHISATNRPAAASIAERSASPQVSTAA